MVDRAGSWPERTGREGLMFYAEMLDAELRERSAEEARIATSLVELEQHPGHRLLTSAPLTGATAARWAAVGPVLAGLWRDFGLYREAVEAARRVRGTRAKPADTALAELHRLLVEPSVEVARTQLGLSERGLTGAAERVEKITLTALSTRMHSAFDEVSELIITCGRLHEDALARLAPEAARLREADRLAAELDVRLPERDAVAATLLDLEGRAIGDPLALGGGQTPGADPVTALSTALSTLTRRLADLASARDQWPRRLAALDAQLRELEALGERERERRRRAIELVAAALPAPPERLPGLRARRAGLDRPAPWSARADALAALTSEVGSAVDELGAAVELADGLVERRAELRGRFEAYRARALRLGCVEAPELVGLEEKIRRMLWARPADLAAATRAVADYQRCLRETTDAGRSA